MPKTILMVHGRHFKPPKTELQKLWMEALRFGMERDHPGKLAALKNAKVELVYYGDISNTFLRDALGEPIPDDLAERSGAVTVHQVNLQEPTGLQSVDGRSGRHVRGAGELLRTE